ncbi:MAG: hypothetical protein AAFU77_08050 [Myxococcota bacterium]
MSTTDSLRGSLVVLERAERGDWDTIHEHFQDPALYEETGLQRAPEKAALFEDLDEEDLVVFHMRDQEDSKLLAYAMFVLYDGAPYFVIHHFEPNYELDLARDAITQLIYAFFRNSDEPRLYFFTPRPVSDDIHDTLLEGGFDPIDDYPVIDNTKEACYCLERFTYEAYYEDDEDDAEQELEF